MTAELWPELVAAATEQVAQIERGDNLAARGVLGQAIVGLRDVVAGRQPDPERLVYLQFLLRALEQIVDGVQPKKALGLWANNAPKSVPDMRGVSLFINVGLTLDRPNESGRAKSVKAAIGEVAKRLGYGNDTVKDAWESHGATKGWKSARDGLREPGADDLNKGEITPRLVPSLSRCVPS
jgi:hypothetical protein